MHCSTALLIVLLAFTLASPVLGEAVPEPHRQPNLMELNEEQAALLTPILQQVRSVLATHYNEVAALEAKIQANDAPLEVRALEEQVADAKIAVEIRILDIQAEFALKDGRTAEAEEFTNLAEKLRHPAPRQAVAAAPQRQEVSR